MIYRIELSKEKAGDKIWFNSFWLALNYFLSLCPEVSDTPIFSMNRDVKLYKGRKKLAEIRSRNGWYPYYVKFYGTFTKEEYEDLKIAIGCNLVHNQVIRDKYTRSTGIEDWHKYLLKEDKWR